MRTDPAVSVCIPLFNEQDNVNNLVRRVHAVLEKIPGGPHEILIIDDGSEDETGKRVRACQQNIPGIRLVTFSRNFGHQQALTAALAHARGDVAFLIDGDLQDPPEVLPDFVRLYKEGYDVVYAVRQNRKENALLRLAYRTHYRLMSMLSDVPIPMHAGDFSLLSKRVVELINSSPETNRYLRGLRAWVGFRQIGVPVERDARGEGMSKYSFMRLIKLALDGLLSFSVLPLRVSTLLGTLIVIASGLFGLYSIYAKFFLDRSPTGFTALILSIILLGGVQLISLGIIGEYIGRIYEEVKRRPKYIISSIDDSDTGP